MPFWLMLNSEATFDLIFLMIEEYYLIEQFYYFDNTILLVFEEDYLLEQDY